LLNDIPTQILEKNTSNKNISILRYFLLLIFIVLVASSCNPTKYVPQDESLLDENHIIINNEGIKKSDLEPYIKQKPNKRIFGTKFHLGLYNLSNINKQKWPHSWLREIGEEPVIFDPYSTTKTKEDIKSYVASKGYFDGQVMETVETANQKSQVYYNVDLKSPYTIRNLYYEIDDTTIKKFFIFDSLDCMIERGKPYDVDILQAERSRFVRYIKDQGFYNFSGEHIHFNIDSTIGNRQVNIYYGIKKFMVHDAYNRVTLVPHQKFMVKNIYIYPDFVPKDVLEGGTEYLKSFDTINYKGYFFITQKEKPEIKYDLIVQSLYLKPGSDYSVTKTEESQSHLLSLKTFRLVNIFYNEIPENDAGQGSGKMLDCTIQLTLLSQQSFKVELEGTNRGGYLGGALNLIYQHKNLFRGAELFNLKLKGSKEVFKQKDKFAVSEEYGIETSLRFPKFLFPFLKKEDFIRKYNPTTTLLAGINKQNMMPLYNRTMANITFGYNWNATKNTSHIVNPIQLNFVKIDSIDPDFQARLDASSYLFYGYKNVMILAGNYSFIFNDQMTKSSKHWFLRVNAESAGNMLAGVSKLTGFPKNDSIFGLPYAQYIRADLDLRFNYIPNDVSSFVLRGFVGAGIPYGNSIAMPFEKQYFGGGANGIRAWQVRTLGPGSYVPNDTAFLNQTADIKLEANAEYRFKLFWILEGALFLDAGNIWAYPTKTAKAEDKISHSGALFSKKFFNEIAVGTGAGLRLNLDFVLLRVDFGIKLRDPKLSSGSRWIIMNQPYSKNDFTVVFGIGYPF
jgi:outer membrane protein assembly factor BamA